MFSYGGGGGSQTDTEFFWVAALNSTKDAGSLLAGGGNPGKIHLAC